MCDDEMTCCGIVWFLGVFCSCRFVGACFMTTAEPHIMGQVGLVGGNLLRRLFQPRQELRCTTISTAGFPTLEKAICLWAPTQNGHQQIIRTAMHMPKHQSPNASGLTNATVGRSHVAPFFPSARCYIRASELPVPFNGFERSG